MVSMVVMVTSLVHLMMIGQKGCNDGRERCRSSLTIISYFDYNHHYYDNNGGHGGHGEKGY